MSMPFLLYVWALMVLAALTVGTAVRIRMEGVGWRHLWLAPVVLVLVLAVWPVELVLRARFRAAVRVVRLYPQLVGVAARRFLRQEGKVGVVSRMLRSVRECRVGLEELLASIDRETYRFA